jgi:uncharacterized protein (TIRG00374 family)
MTSSTSEKTPVVSESNAVGKSGHRWRVLLRLLVGAGVIAFLLARTNLGALADTVRRVEPGYLVAAFTAIVAGVVVSAVRWQAFLRVLGVDKPLSSLTRLYFVGMFFNAFLPTGVGGDAYKALRLRRDAGSLARSLSSTILDRLAGVAGLALLGTVAAAVRAGAGERGRTVAAAAICCAAIVVAVAAIVWMPGIVARLIRAVPVRRVRTAGAEVLDAITRASRDRRAGTIGLVTGVAFQALVLGFHMLLVAGLHLHVDPARLMCVIVVVTVASFIPLTFNGLGFREAAYVWTLGAYGISAPRALALSLLVVGLLLAGSAVGGILYIGGHRADGDP